MGSWPSGSGWKADLSACVGNVPVLHESKSKTKPEEVFRPSGMPIPTLDAESHCLGHTLSELWLGNASANPNARKAYRQSFPAIVQTIRENHSGGPKGPKDPAAGAKENTGFLSGLFFFFLVCSRGGPPQTRSPGGNFRRAEMHHISWSIQDILPLYQSTRVGAARVRL